MRRVGDLRNHLDNLAKIKQDAYSVREANLLGLAIPWSVYHPEAKPDTSGAIYSGHMM